MVKFSVNLNRHVFVMFLEIFGLILRIIAYNKSYLPTDVCNGTRPYGHGSSVFNEVTVVSTGRAVVTAWQPVPDSVSIDSYPGGHFIIGTHSNLPLFVWGTVFGAHIGLGSTF